jgi:hypothetical protein
VHAAFLRLIRECGQRVAGDLVQPQGRRRHQATLGLGQHQLGLVFGCGGSTGLAWVKLVLARLAVLALTWLAGRWALAPLWTMTGTVAQLGPTSLGVLALTWLPGCWALASLRAMTGQALDQLLVALVGGQQLAGQQLQLLGGERIGQADLDQGALGGQRGTQLVRGVAANRRWAS